LVLRLKLDENMPGKAAQMLRAVGHDAMTVSEQALGGSIDETLIQICRSEARTLLTLDLDFADIRSYPPAEHAGIIVLRLARQDVPSLLCVVERLLLHLERANPHGQLWIVDGASKTLL
jgi:predicted nuclease of predicted toxin-antitoxin system